MKIETDQLIQIIDDNLEKNSSDIRSYFKKKVNNK